MIVWTMAIAVIYSDHKNVKKGTGKLGIIRRTPDLIERDHKFDPVGLSYLTRHKVTPVNLYKVSQ